MGNIFSRISDPKMNVIRNKRINSFLVPPKSHLDSLGLDQTVWLKTILDRTVDTGFTGPVKVSALQHSDDSDHGLGQSSKFIFQPI